MRIIRLSRLLIIPVLGFICMASRCNVRHAILSENRRDTSIYKEMRFTLCELKINNDRFLKDLDEIIFADKLRKLKNSKFKWFVVRIKEDDDDTTLFIQYLRDPSPFCLGFFIYKNSVFTVSGINPNGLFSETEAYEEFSYWMPRRDIDIIIPPPPPESFPSWLLEYRDRRLFLIDKRVW